ncbi:MAG: substrate-binding domain-containing protein [Hyphomicrobiales bacterium]|nr:substrate-binding domain-containing protein [Hyphomicrobiales bacterium]
MSVSRAMRGVEGVSETKRCEIREIARQLGYAPNRMAGGLAARDSTLIGVSVPTLFDAVFAEIFEGMRAVFTKAGFQTVIDTTEYEAEREEQWISRMISWHPAGVILSGVHHSRRTREVILKAGIPALEIWDYSDNPIDMCVGIDHTAAGRSMGDYLIEIGYRRPAYVGVSLGRYPRAEDRLDGLAAAFQDFDITVGPIERSVRHASFEGGRNATAAFSSVRIRCRMSYTISTITWHSAA